MSNFSDLACKVISVFRIYLLSSKCYGVILIDPSCVNISEQTSGTERTKKRKKRETSRR